MRFVKYLGAILSIAGILYVFYVLLRPGSNVYDLAVEPRFLAALAAAATAIATSLFLGSIGWYLLLSVFAPGRAFRLVVSIFLTTQIAKYLPGNVGHFIGRAAMLKSHDVPVGASTKAIVLEMLVLLLVGGTMSLIFMSQWLLPALRHMPIWLPLVVTCLAVAALLAFWTSPRIRSIAMKTAADMRASWSRFPAVAIINVINFGLNGAAMWVAASILFPEQTIGLPLCIGIASASFLAGYLTPGSPAGIGVREAVSMLLLAPVFAPDQAAAISLALRLSAVLVDILGFLVGAGLVRQLASRG